MHERLIGALVRNINSLSSAEILRSLLAVMPVTNATLSLVRKCLRPLPSAEVTRLRSASMSFAHTASQFSKEIRMPNSLRVEICLPADVREFVLRLSSPDTMAVGPRKLLT